MATTTGSTNGTPTLIDLASAAMEIRQACDELGAEVHRSPFFFVTGAGLSFPPVPLASSIVEHCRDVAQRYHRTGQPEGAQALDLYSYWFSRAYPGARQRQQYLRTLIEGKPLSLASLRMGHLLSARRLTNLLVTTNFDDFVARALRLFGTEPAVCDHPRTVGRIDRDRDDVQIVHVHGSHLFYDCANLHAEVTDRARAEEETSFTMVGLLDSLLWTRSPLVIGYSGWEGDVIMSALRRRLRGGNPMAQSVYWFCYRRDNVDALPAWLRSSPDVRFVVPAERSATPGADALDRRGQPAATLPPEPTMPAFSVLDQLNRAFDIGAPALFENPIESFAKSLEAALPPTDGAAGDPYAFKALVDRLHEAARRFAVQPRAAGADVALDRLRALMRESQYEPAPAILAEIVPARFGRLAIEERAEVVTAAQLVAPWVFERFEGDALAEHQAHALVFDAQLERTLGPLPRGTAWLMASHWTRRGMEAQIKGRPYGAFSYHLVDTLADPDADADRDGRISMLEATVAAARRVLAGRYGPVPAIAGDVTNVGLFSTQRVERPKGCIHALLVAMDSFAWGGSLAGPRNDVARLQRLLTTRARRLSGSAQVRVLVNDEAGVADVGRALAAMCQAAGPDDTLFFYYSGMGSRDEPDGRHGADPRLFALLHGQDPDGLDALLTHRMLLDALATTAAGQRIVVLDF